jgi:secondary thiamine-phosphate synthase enzyme
MTRLTVRTAGKEVAVDVTAQVAEAASAAGVGEGAMLVWCPHTTAGVFVNEGHDPDVLTDIAMVLSRLAPEGLPYRHGEGNSPAHLKTLLGGCHVTVPVSGGRLALGQWQRILFFDYDGPRTRELWLQPLAGMPG